MPRPTKVVINMPKNAAKKFPLSPLLKNIFPDQINKMAIIVTLKILLPKILLSAKSGSLSKELELRLVTSSGNEVMAPKAIRPK